MALLESVILRDVIANIPAAGAAGRLFISTDENKVYRDNSATWDEVVIAAGGGATGDISANTFVLNDGSELTIATGAITLTKARHTVDTEADASSDDLTTINGLAVGEMCIISAQHTDRTVVVKNSGGNIACSTGGDITLDATEKEVLLYGRASTVLAIPLYNLGSSGGSGLPTFGTGVTKTISSDVVAAGSDRNLIIAAETGTADNLIEITGLAVGDKVLLRADAGDTITVKHNSGSATIKIHLYNNADVVLDEQNPLELTLVATNVLAQPIDANSGSAVFRGADGFAFTDPNLQTWTALNQGSGTYATTNNRLAIKEDGNGSTNIRGWFMTAPSAPYTVTAYIKGNYPLIATNGFFFGHRESASGKLVGLFSLYSSAVGQYIISKLNTATSFNSSYGSLQALSREAYWVRITDNNTNLIWEVSSDGTVWHTIDTRARTDFLTPNQIVFGVYATSAATALDITASMQSLAFT